MWNDFYWFRGLVVVVGCFALWRFAPIFCTSVRNFSFYKDRPLLVCVAIGAYVVKRLIPLMILLDSKQENSRAYFVKIIFLCCLFPVKKLHHFFFDITLRIQQFMILRLETKNRALERNNGIR